jgi:hypothetical protein
MMRAVQILVSIPDPRVAMHATSPIRDAPEALPTPIPRSPAWVETLAREWRGAGQRYWLTRFVILRLLGLMYLVAFLVLAQQIVPLIGDGGLTPARDFLSRVAAHSSSAFTAFVKLPSLFWFALNDTLLRLAAWLGVALSVLVVAGYANAVLLFVLWLLYGSFVHVGQVWYGYGWEIQLLETGLLACFLCPLLDGRPFPRLPPPTPVIWLFRWLCVRVMWGAGLIKLRGDECWRDLSCLYSHYETQPIPGPLSRLLHFAPRWFHQAGVLFNHLVELVAPFFAFGPRRGRHVAGVLFTAFQLFLIVSGNLSFLNWLTIVPALACFDDSFWRRVLPRALVRRAERAERESVVSAASRRAVVAVFFVVAVLSVFPVVNLLSSRQAMNRSYNPIDFVNTYGAFGSVGRERHEIVFEGTSDLHVSPSTRWKAYEFKCKPGAPDRRPCWITPYHLRLDWQIWFAAMTDPAGAPWAVHLVRKLLQGDRAAEGLLAHSPFQDRPPRHLRAVLYRYRYAAPGSGAYWTRTEVGVWLPPLSRDDPRLLRFLQAYGWR